MSLYYYCSYYCYYIIRTLYSSIARCLQFLMFCTMTHVKKCMRKQHAHCETEVTVQAALQCNDSHLRFYILSHARKTNVQEKSVNEVCVLISVSCTDFSTVINRAGRSFKKAKIDISDYKTEVSRLILSQTSWHPW